MERIQNTVSTSEYEFFKVNSNKFINSYKISLK